MRVVRSVIARAPKLTVLGLYLLHEFSNLFSSLALSRTYAWVIPHPGQNAPECFAVTGKAAKRKARWYRISLLYSHSSFELILVCSHFSYSGEASCQKRFEKSSIWGELTLSECGEHLREINTKNDLFHPLFCAVPTISTNCNFCVLSIKSQIRSVPGLDRFSLGGRGVHQ